MLPDELLRFPDLKRVGVRNHTTLRRWQDTQAFPLGRLLGPNTRVWTVSEVEAWWDSRVEPPPEITKPGPSGATDGTGLVKAKAGSQSNQTDRRIESIPEAFPNGRAR